ncbi:hypothetical protein EEZ25_31650 [Micromonospora aurantiaca]|uniref:hypothetical protein n=1 Tax=Micromonospora aurantiaca (nom. illeg.) TaxID=47850 RepID=UPI000F3CB655|nr:hypothetical protein [Micromonospora aurantiaca]RNH94180.1 hypothetical protein EEZ25_31650 [Micromonospora aurantiaca]
MLMRRTSRCLIAAAAAAIVLASGSPGYADGGIGGVNCTQNPSAPECEISAGTPGGPGGSTGGSQGGGGSGDGSGGGNGCYWAPVDVDLPPPAGKGPEGGWYARTCVANGLGSQDVPVWLDQAPQVDLAALAQTARSRLRLPSPQIHTNPATAPFVLVQVPVWLWVDPATWGARSATASVPGVSVTATATPTRVVWSFGDGSEDLACTGPGKPWKPGTDPRASSPCGHTYTSSSAVAAGAAFRLRATVTWSVTWSGAGSGGALAPLTTTSAVSVRVAESQAIVGGVR